MRERIQSGIKAVIPCDANKVDMIWSAPDPEPYDLITTSLAIEAATSNITEFNGVIKKLVNLYLKPGGMFVMAGVLQQSKYQVGDNTYFSVKYNVEDVENAFKGAGLEKPTWRMHDIPPNTYGNTDCIQYYTLYSKKL